MTFRKLFNFVNIRIEQEKIIVATDIDGQAKILVSNLI